MKAKSTNLIQIHLAILLVGFSGLFAKLIDLDPSLIVLGRTFFAALTLGLTILLLKQKFKVKKETFFGLAFTGAVLAVHWITFFKSIQISTVAIGLISFSTFPVFVTFLEPYFFKEKLQFTDVMTAAIAFLGVVLVVPEFNLANNISQGVLLGIIAGLTCAIVSIFNKKYVQEVPSVLISFYQNATAAILLLPMPFFHEACCSNQDIMLLALLGVVFTALAQSLFIKGMTHIKAQTASVITCLEPVYGVIFAFIILGESLDLRTIIGGLVILSATTYTTIKHS